MVNYRGFSEESGDWVYGEILGFDRIVSSDGTFDVVPDSVGKQTPYYTSWGKAVYVGDIGSVRYPATASTRTRVMDDGGTLVFGEFIEIDGSFDFWVGTDANGYGIGVDTILSELADAGYGDGAFEIMPRQTVFGLTRKVYTLYIDAKTLYRDEECEVDETLEFHSELRFVGDEWNSENVRDALVEELRANGLDIYDREHIGLLQVLSGSKLTVRTVNTTYYDIYLDSSRDDDEDALSFEPKGDYHLFDLDLGSYI